MIVYVDKNKPGVPVPKVINGVRTLVIPTDAASMSAGTAPTTLPEVEGIHLPAEVCGPPPRCSGDLRRS